MLLESLSPEQRAAFLLREVFDYPYAEIAEIIGTTRTTPASWSRGPAATSEERRPRFEARGSSAKSWLSASSPPPSDGDLRALEALLAQDVALHGDGGGKVPALARPVNGRAGGTDAVGGDAARRARTAASATSREVNGQPGAMVIDAQGRLVAVMGLDIADGQIQTIHSIANPDKLRHLGPIADLDELLAGD